MSSCRCSEIKQCADDLKTLNDMLGDLATAKTTQSSLATNLKNASSVIGGVYSSANMAQVKTKMETLGDDWETVISGMEGKINSKISEIQTKKSQYETEDEDYHNSEED